jgi:hypothetical protein
MRLLILSIAALAFSATASAQVHVRGYTTKSGTYVAPHYRSSPDSSKLNNWSTKGNVNPYTGQPGTKNPYSNSYSNPYSSYSNPYSSSSTQNSSSATTCYYPPC